MSKPAVLVASLFIAIALVPAFADDTSSPKTIRAPRRGAAIKVAATSQIVIPGDASVLARSHFDPLVLMPGEMGQVSVESRGPLAKIHGGRLEKMIGEWSIGLTGVEARATLGDHEAFVVISGPASGGYGSESVHAMMLHDLLSGKGEESALPLPAGLRSPSVVRSGIRLLATGYTYEDPSDRAATGRPGRGEEQAQNIVVYDLAGGGPVMLAMIERFSEHAENNLAAGITRDGIVQLLATEVLVSHGNSARVHLLQFDVGKRRWLSDRVLFERSEFTSTITPRVVTQGAMIDAFWLPEGGAEKRQSDGLYAFRVGEATIWRLTDSRGEYAVLPNADGHGAVLVGVAVHPSEDGKVRWFVRRGGKWTNVGETDLGVKLYTLTTTGTDPFALWRDLQGQIHAAFRSSDKLQIIDLKLPL
jgi:hypothetical protein